MFVDIIIYLALGSKETRASSDYYSATPSTSVKISILNLTLLFGVF